MFKPTAIRITLLIALFAPVLPIAYADSAVSSIIDRGLDGSVRIFSVLCVGGKRGSIDYYFKDGDVCYSDKEGKPICGKWSLHDAATRICQIK